MTSDDVTRFGRYPRPPKKRENLSQTVKTFCNAPTPAQIDAAAKALMDASIDNKDGMRGLARAALTAAAEVGGPKSKCVAEHMGGKRCVGRCMDPKDCSGDPLSAAEVGEPTTYGHLLGQGPAIKAKNEAIERCAQALADYWEIAPYSPLEDLLAAIRKLKDGP